MHDEVESSGDIVTPDEPAAMPGQPLGSGFKVDKRPSGARLSESARARVLEKMRSVDQARLRAAQDSRTSYVG